MRLEDLKISESQLELVLVSNITWSLIYGFIHYFIRFSNKTKTEEVYDSKHEW